MAATRVAAAGTVPDAAARSASRSRPSTITTSSTPPPSACSHARSFAIIPAVGRAAADQPRDRRRVEQRHRRAALVEHAGRRAGDDEPARAEPRGQVSGHRVGVDVQQLPVRGRRRCTPRPARTRPAAAPRAPACRRRRPAGPRARGRPAVRRPCDAAAPASDKPAPAVGAREAHRRHARGAERRDEPRVDGAGQHRHDDVERGVVGDAQAVHLTLLDAGGLQRRVDLLAAAVDDDQRDGVRRAALTMSAMAATTPAMRDGSSSSSPPNFSDQRLRHSSPVARRGRASRSCSARPGPRRP